MLSCHRPPTVRAFGDNEPVPAGELEEGAIVLSSVRPSYLRQMISSEVRCIAQKIAIISRNWDCTTEELMRVATYLSFLGSKHQVGAFEVLKQDMGGGDIFIDYDNRPDKLRTWYGGQPTYDPITRTVPEITQLLAIVLKLVKRSRKKDEMWRMKEEERLAAENREEVRSVLAAVLKDPGYTYQELGRFAVYLDKLGFVYRQRAFEVLKSDLKGEVDTALSVGIGGWKEHMWRERRSAMSEGSRAAPELKGLLSCVERMLYVMNERAVQDEGEVEGSEWRL